MIDLEKAAKTQRRLSERLSQTWDSRHVNLVAGADCSYDRRRKLVGAAVVVLSFPEMSFLYAATEIRDIPLPYIPGFLNFREGPVFLRAFRKLSVYPDVSLIDGNGIAHPRRMGLASYLGVVLGVPTVGCAKSPFYPHRLPRKERGRYTIFKDDRQEQVGYCLRTRSGVKPVFVSPGHRIDFRTAKAIVLACSRSRIPEPLRLAHLFAKRLFF